MSEFDCKPQYRQLLASTTTNNKFRPSNNGARHKPLTTPIINEAHLEEAAEQCIEALLRLATASKCLVTDGRATSFPYRAIDHSSWTVTDGEDNTSDEPGRPQTFSVPTIFSIGLRTKPLADTTQPYTYEDRPTRNTNRPCKVTRYSPCQSQTFQSFHTTSINAVDRLSKPTIPPGALNVTMHRHQLALKLMQHRTRQAFPLSPNLHHRSSNGVQLSHKVTPRETQGDSYYAKQIPSPLAFHRRRRSSARTAAPAKPPRTLRKSAAVEATRGARRVQRSVAESGLGG
jgi:hypothetical protein